jgi:hypothetical protein
MSVKTYAQNLVAASRWKPLMHNFVVRICRLFLLMAATTSTNPSLITASASLPIGLNDFFVGVILIFIFFLLRGFFPFLIISEFSHDLALFFSRREFFSFLIISEFSHSLRVFVH